MKDLIGLIGLIPYETLDDIYIHIANDPLSHRRKALYEEIKSGNVTSIEEARERIFPGISDEGIKKTTNRLLDQLTDSLFFLHINRYSTDLNQNRLVELYKRFATIKILEQLAEYDLFASMAEKLIAKARRLDQHEITMLLAGSLEYYYSFIRYDKKKSTKYGEEFKQANEKIEAFRRISQLYYELAGLIIRGKTLQEADHILDYQEDINRLESLRKTNASILFNHRIFSIIYFYNLLTKNYSRMVESSLQAIKFYETIKPVPTLRIFTSKLRLGVAYLYLDDRHNARNHIVALAEYHPTPGTLHWNSWKSYSFMLEMISSDYQKAGDILFGVTTNKEFKKLDNIWFQQWNIRSAYIHFLFKLGRVDFEAFGKSRIPNFRLKKFLNNVPAYSKDKRGLNISILIAQFIILLVNKDYGGIEERIEALSKYSYRHLRNDFRLRSNCFIRMLLEIPKADYHPIRTSRYVAKYVKRLENTEINLNEFSTEIEIIPYEELWSLIIDLLSQRIHR
jgi:hypothetical protein